MSDTKVTIIDVTPRDGLQNEAAMLNLEQKSDLMRRLIAAKLPAIEFGSFVSPKAVPQMAGSSELFTAMDRPVDVQFPGLVPNMRGYENALAAGVSYVRLVVAASDKLHEANFRRSIDESLADHTQIIQRAANDGTKIEAVIGGCFGDPYTGPTPVGKVMHVVDHYYKDGIRDIAVADTVGMGTPAQIREVIKAIQATYPDVTIGTHFHDTRGTGLANVLAALDLGIRRFDSAVGGTGGCPFAPKAGGNIVTEDLVHMLYGMGMDTGINIDILVETALWLEDALGRPLPGKMEKADPVYPVFRPSRTAVIAQ